MHHRLASGGAVALLIASTLVSGCGALGGSSNPVAEEAVAADLRRRMRNFSQLFEMRVQGAAYRIREATKDREIQRRTILWKLYTIPYCREIAIQRDPLAGLLETWVFCRQMRRFFESIEDDPPFGEWNPIAVETSQRLETIIEQVAAAVLPPWYMEQARVTLDRYAAESPISDLFGGDITRPVFGADGRAAGAIDWFLDAPLKPLRAIGGMDHTARAILEVAHVAESSNLVVRNLPEQVRWQTQLLALDLGERPEVEALTRDVEVFAQSAERISKAAETLPEDVGRQVVEVLGEVERQQEDLRETFGELRATLASLDETLGSAGRIAGDFSRAGDAWEGTIRTLWAMIDDLSGEPEPEPEAEDGEGTSDGAEGPEGPSGPEPAAAPAEEARPFDILDYEKTAGTLGETAAELRSAIEELRRLVLSDELAGAVERSSAEVDALVARVTWRVVGVIGALLLAALVYRWFATRWSRGSPSAR